MTTVSAIPIYSEDETTVGWVPIEESSSPTSSVMTEMPGAAQSSLSTTEMIGDYSTTSFKDAQIQYRPLAYTGNDYISLVGGPKTVNLC